MTALSKSNKVRQRRTGPEVEYSEQLIDEIFHRVANGESLNAICADAHMPLRTAVHNWIRENKDGAYDKYARARELRAEFLADETLDIADSVMGAPMEMVQAARLAVDTRRWAASKLAPRTYGDKIAVGGDDDRPIKHLFLWGNEPEPTLIEGQVIDAPDMQAGAAPANPPKTDDTPSEANSQQTERRDWTRLPPLRG